MQYNAFALCSSKFEDFDTSQKHIRDFLLVINNNLGPVFTISKIRRQKTENHKFSRLLSFNVLAHLRLSSRRWFDDQN